MDGRHQLGQVGVGISRLHVPVTTLGPGRRVGVWFQGCSIGCNGCVSGDTWRPADSEDSVAVDDLVRWVRRSVAAQHGAIQGVTVSGGEPFQQPNALHAFLTLARSDARLAALDVLVYSGYSYETLRRRAAHILPLIDAMICGPYVEGRPSQNGWYGSDNQQMHILNTALKDRFLAPPTRPKVQVDVTDGRVWLTGIPRRGDLARMEQLLARRGVHLEDVSWRP